MQLGFVSDLTTDHVEATDGGLVVDAPSGTSEIRIERTFLRDRLGAWGADHAFTLANDRVVAGAETVTFTSFRANGTPTYTLGSWDSIRFVERPMWLSVDQDGDDGPITVTADAADTTGQPVEVDAAWLWENGIVAPRAVHEDGSQIPVAWVDNGWAYRFEVPHFSAWSICDSFTTDSGSPDCQGFTDVSAELDVKVRVNGVMTAHEGEERWDAKNRTLHVEVDDYLTEVDVLVERAWVDDHIDHLAVWRRTVWNESVDGTEYYVSSFPTDDTPTDHVLREYGASNKTMYTRGNFDESIATPVWTFMKVDPSGGNLSLTTRPRAGSNVSHYPVFINDTFLQDRNVSYPEPYNQTNDRLDLGGDRNVTYFYVTANASAPADVEVRNGSGLTASSHDTCNTGSMEYLTTWNHDMGESSSQANLYVAGRTFCFQWSLWPGDAILWSDIDFWSVYGNITDMNDNLLCDIRVPAGDRLEEREGFRECEVGEDTTIPDDILAGFHAHSINRERSAHWYAEKGAEFADKACPVGAVGIAIYNPEPAISKAYAAFCAVTWVVDAGYDLELLPAEDDYNIESEAIITNARTQLNVSSSITVNLIDTNTEREDTWDILEENVNIDLVDHPAGPQSINWEVKNVEHADLDYDSDQSHIDQISAATDDNENYRTTDWNAGQTYLEATAWDTVTDFEDPDLDLQKVNWEAPDPVWNEGTIGCEGVMDAYVDFDVEDLDPEPDPPDPWINVTVTGFEGLDPANVADEGNISTNDVEHWGSMAKALANATVDNSTFVENSCGGYAGTLKELLSYEYESTMVADSSGYSTVGANTQVTAADEEVIPIRWYYVPPP